MQNYLFNISEEERKNILDKHKTLYDGYAVRENQPNTQPLYIQDFANDKGGITINSNGEVSTYNNKIYMKESKNVCSECGLYEEVCECGKAGMYESECSECGGMMSEGECMECGYKKVRGIGDKFDYVEQEDDTDLALALGSEVQEDECMECGKGMYETDIEEIMDEIEEEIEFKDESYDIKESINESLDMFRRFRKFN